jgi:hypothetical protein
MLRATRSFAVLLGVCFAFAGCQGPVVPPAEQYATIVGTVLDATANTPIAGVTIAVNVVNTAVTKSDGKFSIGNLPNGPYDVQITPPAQYVCANCPTGGNLSPGQTLTLQVTLTHT